MNDSIADDSEKKNNGQMVKCTRLNEVLNGSNKWNVKDNNFSIVLNIIIAETSEGSDFHNFSLVCSFSPHLCGFY